MIGLAGALGGARYTGVMTRIVLLAWVLAGLGLCGCGSRGGASGGGAMSKEIREGKAQLAEIASLFSAYTIENTASLPRTMDDLAATAGKLGKADPREFVSPFAGDEGPRGYAWLTRKEKDISKVWDDSVIAYDAAGEHAGYPGVNVLFASGAAMTVDLAELRRVLRAHGVETSQASIDIAGLEGEPGAKKMYPLR